MAKQTKHKIRKGWLKKCENRMKKEKLDYSENIGHKSYAVFILWSNIKGRKNNI